MTDVVAEVIRKMVHPAMVEERNRVWAECPHVNTKKVCGSRCLVECMDCGTRFGRA